MKILRTLVCVLIVGSASVSQAVLLQVDFAGVVASQIMSAEGPLFSGWVLLDTNVADERPEPDNALYGGAVIGGEFDWDGVVYTWTSGIFNDVFVLNDQSVVDDTFAIVGTFDSETGVEANFSLQLKDSSRTVFDSDAFPLQLSLQDFDGFEPGNALSSQTFLSPSGVATEVGRIDFLKVSQVPLPAGLWLLPGALAALAGLRRRSPG